ncbi:MAG: TonB-dependent receptor [Cytophagales bacterium]|nr:TonB-dependent receptor [Cytophagales bacterium]
MNRSQLIFLFFLLNSMRLFAQIDTTIVMSDLLISGNRISTPFSEASRNIHIITSDEIKRKPVQSVPEILTYSPGVDIRQRGPMGVQADIGIRGGTFEQTLVLLNGIKLTDPQTGHHIMSIPIPIDNIHRIEVLKGPGARIFGQNAFAGSVNFITKAPETGRIGFRGYGGSFGSWGGNISISVPIGSYKQFLSYNRDASDGFRHNTDYKQNNVFYQSHVATKNGKYELIFGLTDRKFGANGFYASSKFTEQYEELRTSITSISYETQKNNLRIKPRIYWRWNRDKYLFIRENPSAYQNLHKTNTYGAEINASYRSSIGTTGFGVEYRKEEITGDWVRGGNESKSNLHGFGRDNFGFYADHKFKIGNKFDFTPGIYVNWYSDFGWNAFPGMDLGYNLNDKIRIYGNVGKSYRIPTFYDQYYSSPVEEGNPNLKPEEAVTYELGLRYIQNGLTLDVNYFQRDASQLIDWVLNPVDSIWRSQNFQNITTNGIEFVANLDFLKLVGSNFPIINATLSYNYLDQNLSAQENAQSRYALEHITNQIIFGLEHRIIGKLKNSFKMRYIDRFEQDPYLLIDDRMYYEINEQASVFVEAANLTGQTYTEVMTPMPGRWFRAGVHINIGL